MRLLKLGYLVFMGCILLLALIVAAGWLQSLLMIGGVALALYLYNYFCYKSAKLKESQIKVFSIVLTCLFVGLIIYGIVVFFQGLAPGTTSSSYVQKCGWCGGSGVTWSAERGNQTCKLCHGLGGAVGESLSLLGNPWIGLVILICGGCGIWVKKMIDKG